jgi:hypothetical protein
VTSAQDRLPDKAEMIGSVLNAIKAIGALDAPAVPARLDDSVRG